MTGIGIRIINLVIFQTQETSARTNLVAVAEATWKKVVEIAKNRLVTKEPVVLKSVRGFNIWKAVFCDRFFYPCEMQFVSTTRISARLEIAFIYVQIMVLDRMLAKSCCTFCAHYIDTILRTDTTRELFFKESL